MTDKTLPTLSATTAPAADSIFIVRRNGQTEDEKVTGANLKTFMNTTPAISGGTIDNTIIGGTTAAAGSFTTLVSNTINTGQGAVECYAMDQAVRTTDAVTFSSMTLSTDLAVTHGGTGASTATNARTNLGLAIGSDVQAYSAVLAATTASFTTADETKLDGIDPGASATLAGLSDVTIDTPANNNLLFYRTSSSTWENFNTTTAKSLLGLTIGTDVQAYDAGLQSISGLTTLADRMIYTTASDTYAVTTLTSFARTLLDDTSNSTARTTLGLGSIATQAASAVTITGGSITGITDITIADGGTGASTAGGARTNLGLGSIATQESNNVTITGGTVSGITDITVADGGTGRSTATAYAVLCGGTTSTGAHQSIASVGTSGQVLTSNGAAALPTFQTLDVDFTPSSEITVATGTQTYAAAHGLGAIPNDFIAVLRCKTANNGYTVNQEVRFNGAPLGDAGRTFVVTADATNVTARQYVDIALPALDSASAFVITYAQWKLVLKWKA